jgi:hypothetical protein
MAAVKRHYFFIMKAFMSQDNTNAQPSAADILAMIRSQHDRLYQWRQQFINEEHWDRWRHTPEGLIEIIEDPAKGESWWGLEPMDDAQHQRFRDLVARLRARHE